MVEAVVNSIIGMHCRRSYEDMLVTFMRYIGGITRTCYWNQEAVVNSIIGMRCRGSYEDMLVTFMWYIGGITRTCYWNQVFLVQEVKALVSIAG